MTAFHHLVCPHCNAVNRLPSARLGDEPACGKCHLSLFEGRPVQLNRTSFEKHLSRSEIPLVVDFWASWCGPCKMMAPAFEKAAQALEPGMRFAKVDTEAESQLASRFNIRSIPTMILFRQGREIARHSGAVGERDIIRWIEGQLGQ